MPVLPFTQMAVNQMCMPQQESNADDVGGSRRTQIKETQIGSDVCGEMAANPRTRDAFLLDGVAWLAPSCIEGELICSGCTEMHGQEKKYNTNSQRPRHLHRPTGPNPSKVTDCMPLQNHPNGMMAALQLNCRSSVVRSVKDISPVRCSLMVYKDEERIGGTKSEKFLTVSMDGLLLGCSFTVSIVVTSYGHLPWPDGW